MNELSSEELTTEDLSLVDEYIDILNRDGEIATNSFFKTLTKKKQQKIEFSLKTACILNRMGKKNKK